MTAPDFPIVDVSARRFALAWRAVQAAASTDPDRPALYRTTLIERHVDGIRLVSTDGHLMLWAWVPAADADDAPAPDLDEAPWSEVLVADPSGLPAALAKYLAKSTKLGGGSFDRKSPVTLAVGVFDDRPNEPTLGGELDRPGLIITAFNETVVAPVVGHAFPDWRTIARHAPVKSAAKVGIAGRYLARLGGITTDDMGGVWLTMLGQKNGIAVSIPGDPHIHGRVMPLADDEAPRAMNTHVDVVEPTGALAEFEGEGALSDAEIDAEWAIVADDPGD